MASNANFATTPRYEVAQVSTANTARDGTGTIVTLFTAGPNGSRVDNIGWSGTGTTSAGLVSVFVRETSEGTWMYITSLPINANTASATNAPHFGAAHNLNWVLSAGAEIGIATTIAQTVNVHVFLAGDF